MLLLLGAGSAGGEHVVEMHAGHDRDAVRVGDDPVTPNDLDIADDRRASDATRFLLRRAAQRDHRREHRKAVQLERLDVTDATVDHQTSQPPRLGSGRQHLTPVAARVLVTDVHDQYRARGGLRDRDVDPRGCRQCCS